MGIVGFSSGVMDDHRILQVRSSHGADGYMFWMESVLLASREGNALTVDSVAELAADTLDPDADPMPLVALLVQLGLWDLVGPDAWRVAESGLWTFDPDDAIDFYGGDTA